MGAMTLQNVCFALGEMKADADYQALATKPMTDEAFHRFWQEVNFAMMRCLTLPPQAPTVAEVRDRLATLHAMTVDTLARFRPFIERAQAVLDAP